ncbi:AzlC family ABC transporter permease [Mesorhizobium marinum]
MTISTARSFVEGMKSAIPVVVAAAPFGLLFGALAVENGLSVADATLMSAAIYGGASQMVGIELFGQHIAPWLVVLSIVAVNFRHVLYSAAIGPRIDHWPAYQQALGFFLLTDPQYAETERRAESGRRVSFAWYMGMGIAIYVPWLAESAIGAMFGKLVPDPRALGIDFLLPIYFLGMVMGFRKRPYWLPIVATSAVASIAAHYTIGSPWHVSVGAVAGIALAAILPVKAAEDSADAP